MKDIKNLTLDFDIRYDSIQLNCVLLYTKSFYENTKIFEVVSNRTLKNVNNYLSVLVGVVQF